MKLKKLLLLILSFVLALTPLEACASENQANIDGIYACLCGDKGLQEWIDAKASSLPGTTTEICILNLNRFGIALDMSGYVRAARNALEDDAIRNPVSRMRCALTLLSCGERGLPAGIADECIGKLGVMSYVYGLHLLNNGVHSDLWTQQSLVEKLIELQKEDGGWSLMGNYGDVDVTAMCLQALACVPDSEAVQAAIDHALAFLSERQLESGGFSGMGNENCESSAQVLIALASLDINCFEDERFIKNGKSCYDALMEYRLPSGGFAHLPGDEESEMACLQALQAFYALDHQGEKYFLLPEISVNQSSVLSGWKLYAMIAVAVFALVGVVFALTRRHGRAKQLIFVLLVAGIAAAGILLLDVETAADYYKADESKPSIGTVYLSIRCDTVAGRAQDESTPSDGVILERTAMPLSEGDSVFDILTDAARKFGIHMEHDGGSGDTAYVTGINYLYEQGYGELSGWLYDVNGERYSVGSGAYALKDGDEVIWQYTLELGDDIK